MATGSSLLERARKHIGEQYVNVRIPKDDPGWHGPWDCAEFMSWLVYQEAGTLYGCTDNNADPHQADAYTGAWERDSKKLGIRIPVEQAAATVGAFLLRYPPGPGKMGHIALSDGRGGTVEAKGKAYGVVADKVSGRRWDTGVLVPGIDYGSAGAPVEVAAPSHLYATKASNMNVAVVTQIQRALAAKGFDPGPIDGDFGPKTTAAVAAFQEAVGFVVDGEVGNTTAEALGVSLSAPASTARVTNVREEPMTPLIAIAASVLPEIVKALAGDKAGSIAASVTNAVTEATGTSDPAVARQKLESDPAAATQLQVKLAEIAVAQEQNRQQAQLDMMRAQFEAEAGRRKDELDSFKASLEDTQSARSAATEWARSGGPMAWGAPAVSVIVTLGFFGILLLLLVFSNSTTLNPNQPMFQIINITVGTLAAAFATVVSFWLGSSQGSRIKDVATLGLQVEQAKQTNDFIKTQTAAAEASRQGPSTDKAPAAPDGPAKFSNFQRCMDVVLLQEGGFSNRADDPGGATQFGITLATLKQWRENQTLTAEDVRNLTREEACEIYRTRYWNVLRCDDLPLGVDLVVFDFGVNAGPGTSARTLQKIVGAGADGSIGPATVAAVKAARPRDVVRTMSQRRLDHYRGLAGWPTFGNGWTNRTNAVEKAALSMIDSATAAAA